MRAWLTALVGLTTILIASQAALAQQVDEKIRIGVLTDMSGLFSVASGSGSVLAAQMAAEEFNGNIRGKAIEIISADHQNKPDVGVGIIRRWFDVDHVDAIADIPVSSIALAAQEIARERKKTLLISGAASSDLYGKACSPYSTQWSDDTYSVATATAKAVLDGGGDSWFFVTVDFALGHALERDASAAVTKFGGKVVGAVRHPIGASDFASYLLQAQSSKAKVIGLSNVGSDTVNTLKQAKEFGISSGGRSLVAFLMYLTDISGVGLDVAQDLLLVDGFYWDQNDQARDWSNRFFKRQGKMPTKDQAATYASIVHYLRAIEVVGSTDAKLVNDQMRQAPVDYFGKKGIIRPDGRVLYDMTLYQVKKPSESKYPWDFERPIRTISMNDAFRPASEGGCNLNR